MEMETSEVILRRHLADGRFAVAQCREGGWLVQIFDPLITEPADRAKIQEEGIAHLDYVLKHPEVFLLEEIPCKSPAGARNTLAKLSSDSIQDSEPMSDVVFLWVGALFVVGGLVTTVLLILDESAESKALGLVPFVIGIAFIGISQMLSLLKALLDKLGRK
ncbi:hypothetical protein H8D30_01405 [bacterium]|nr:hypothetical protein [bacterium]